MFGELTDTSWPDWLPSVPLEANMWSLLDYLAKCKHTIVPGRWVPWCEKNMFHDFSFFILMGRHSVNLFLEA